MPPSDQPMTVTSLLPIAYSSWRKASAASAARRQRVPPGRCRFPVPGTASATPTPDGAGGRAEHGPEPGIGAGTVQQQGPAMVPALSRTIRTSWPAAENQRSQLGKADASKASRSAMSTAANPTGSEPASATRPSPSWAIPAVSTGHDHGIAARHSRSARTWPAPAADGRMRHRIRPSSPEPRAHRTSRSACGNCPGAQQLSRVQIGGSVRRAGRGPVAPGAVRYGVCAPLPTQVGRVPAIWPGQPVSSGPAAA